MCFAIVFNWSDIICHSTFRPDSPDPESYRDYRDREVSTQIVMAHFVRYKG